MPEIPVKEVRLPELRLPEMDRDEIVRAISGRLPDLTVPPIELPVLRRQGRDRSRIDLSRIDLRRLATGAFATFRIVRPAARRVGPVIRVGRWPVVIGVVATLAVVGIALMRSPAVRTRAEHASRIARERMEAMREARATSVDEVPAEIDEGIDPAVTDVAEVIASTEDERQPMEAAPA